jgi:transcriptional regulator with XRE-family HTH domain
MIHPLAMEKTKSTFGKRLRQIRRARGLTLEKLGKAVSIGYKHIADIERGLKAPSFDAIDRLASGLEVQPYQFFWSPELDPKTLDRELRDLLRDVSDHSDPGVKHCVVRLLSLIRKMEAALPEKRRMKLGAAIRDEQATDPVAAHQTDIAGGRSAPQAEAP